MAGVRIVSDSACDLSAEEAAELGIEIVPLTIRFGDEEFTDRRGPQRRRLLPAHGRPPTRCPRPPHRHRAPSSRCSASWPAKAPTPSCASTSPASCRPRSSRPATRPGSLEGEVDVRVIDSRTLTAGLGTVVLEAAKAGRERQLGRRGRRPGRRPRRPHPRVRRARHARQPQEGRPHRRRPGVPRLAAVGQAADQRHGRPRRGGGQAPHPQEGPGGAARPALRGAGRRAPVGVRRRGARRRRLPRPDRRPLPTRRGAHGTHRRGHRHPRRPAGARHLLRRRPRPERRVAGRRPASAGPHPDRYRWAAVPDSPPAHRAPTERRSPRAA